MAKSGRYNRHDRFYEKAKADKYVARSVYKLDELDRRYGLIKKNQTIVDLGCAPGSWLQYLAEKVGRKGAVVGYDIVPVEMGFGPRVVAHVADVKTLTPTRILEDLAELTTKPVDALISDMAPKLTGIRDADQAKSVEMVGYGLRLAQALLQPDRGVFVAKLFQGRDTDGLVEDVRKAFREVKLLKPEATRDGSREVFVLGRNLRREGRMDPAEWEPVEDAPEESGGRGDDGS
ncbi:MAG: RlmE family RNA methyltransferase [Myxococcota bacterium]